MSDPVVGYKVELDVFEGPLDLLLHLVRKHELDILDIPIAFVTEKYLEYLDLMKSLNLDIASEYLLMAATLAHIKSRELLPSQDTGHEEDGDGDEESDPRQELILRLLAYQKYKAAAQSLGDRPVVGRNVWVRGSRLEDALPEEIDPDGDAPLASVPVIRLIEALDKVLSRAKVRLAHTVDVDRLSVGQRIGQLVERLEREGSFSFSSLFPHLEDDGALSMAQLRHEVVVTFLALLEMAKLRLIKLAQPEGEEEIRIAAAQDNLRQAVARSVARDAGDADAGGTGFADDYR